MKRAHSNDNSSKQKEEEEEEEEQDPSETWHFVTADENGSIHFSSVVLSTARDPAVLKAFLERLYVEHAKHKDEFDDLAAEFIRYVKEVTQGRYPSEDEDADEWTASCFNHLKNGNVGMLVDWTKEDWGEWSFRYGSIAFVSTGKHFFYQSWS